MKIEYDPVKRRATDLESGLAVEFVRDEPPLERCTWFRLTTPQGESVEFMGQYNYGEDKYKEKYPGISSKEIVKKIDKSGNYERNYYAKNIKCKSFDKKIFLDLWHSVVSRGNSESIFKYSVFYRELPNSPYTDGERIWSLDNGVEL